MTHLYGLIGYPLGHSFSRQYFTEKFRIEGRAHYDYRNFPIGDIREIEDVLRQNPDIEGFNVTIPYKEQIIPYLNVLDADAEKIGAVNTVKVLRKNGGISLKGFNTDIYGFMTSLREWYASVQSPFPEQAMILGTGGASKAVEFVLRQLSITPHFVSRSEGKNVYATYSQLTAQDIAAHLLTVNTTPLGMYPAVGACPDVPYQYFSGKHFLYDLIYNPAQTLFMKRGSAQSASVSNGARMLLLQAEKAWEIWQADGD
ncbi:MAG: shikimate dehydrogenase [Bacteroidales bacterium]|jgi:shikimate dehydrogenase|nr:shikimate dehydrogenase [Bacteroidales bacterium]